MPPPAVGAERVAVTSCQSPCRKTTLFKPEYSRRGYSETFHISNTLTFAIAMHVKLIFFPTNRTLVTSTLSVRDPSPTDSKRVALPTRLRDGLRAAALPGRASSQPCFAALLLGSRQPREQDVRAAADQSRFRRASVDGKTSPSPPRFLLLAFTLRLA